MDDKSFEEMDKAFDNDEELSEELSIDEAFSQFDDEVDKAFEKIDDNDYNNNRNFVPSIPHTKVAKAKKEHIDTFKVDTENNFKRGHFPVGSRRIESKRARLNKILEQSKNVNIGLE